MGAVVKEASIFDIDGTLLQSVEADGELYALAVQRALGIDSIDTKWSSYQHVTDQGILREILEMHGVAPTPAVFEATKREFLAVSPISVRRLGGDPFAPLAVRRPVAEHDLGEMVLST